jgi:hypothetical protein
MEGRVLTQAQLVEMERCHAKTTWGQWQIVGINGHWVGAFNPATGKLRKWVCETSDDNMEFIVMAHEMWPTLIRTIVDQQKRIAELENGREKG